MKLTKLNLLALSFSFLTILAGCIDTDIDTPTYYGDSGEPIILEPGAVIPWNVKVRINTSGTYMLPSGATVLKTHCFGKIILTYVQPNGITQNNTCHNTTGSSSQTNIVSGVNDVYFDIGAGSFADITLK